MILPGLAAAFGIREGFLPAQSNHVIAKPLVLLAFPAFLTFSIHATRREHVYKNPGVKNRPYWGRQVDLDLYVSEFLLLALIYPVEEAMLIPLRCAPPVFVFANLARRLQLS